MRHFPRSIVFLAARPSKKEEADFFALRRKNMETSKLELLRKREGEIRAKIAEEQAKKRKREEKEETRLTILVGSAFLADVQKTPAIKTVVSEVLQRGIQQEKDREFLKAKGWLQ
jgi:hypothetical protein